VQVDVTSKHLLDDMTRINAEGVGRKEKILESFNDLGSAILVAKKSVINKALIKCMGTIGEVMKADRVQVWRNETVGSNLHFSLTSEWLSDFGTELAEALKYARTYPYSAVPGWEDKLKRGKSVNSPISSLLPHEFAFFSRQNVKSLVAIPLIENKNFRGFLRIDNCREERVLSDEEMSDAGMAGHFITFSEIINENINDIKNEIEKVDELTAWYRSVLDAIPVPILLIDDKMNLDFINLAAESMTGKRRDNVYGKHCSTLGTAICNKPQCGIACARKYINRTFFNNIGKYYQVDVTGLKNQNGDTTGYVEVMQDITSYENRAGSINSEQDDAVGINQ